MDHTNHEQCIQRTKFFFQKIVEYSIVIAFLAFIIPIPLKFTIILAMLALIRAYRYAYKYTFRYTFKSSEQNVSPYRLTLGNSSLGYGGIRTVTLKQNIIGKLFGLYRVVIKAGIFTITIPGLSKPCAQEVQIQILHTANDPDVERNFYKGKRRRLEQMKRSKIITEELKKRESKD